MVSQKVAEQFTKYEIARIIGARALQIAMDAPLLLKISEQLLDLGNQLWYGNFCGFQTAANSVPKYG